ncbi:MAG: MFS transporter [Actinomycetaceae bacterium]
MSPHRRREPREPGLGHEAGSPVDLRAARFVALAASGAFAAFYGVYTAAPVMYADVTGGPGSRVALLMIAVVVVQPLVMLGGRLLRNRAPVVGAALVSLALGCALLPVAGGWPGLVLVGAGFGVFVVAGTAWAREVVPPQGVGRSMALYGTLSATGGALGAPLALVLADGGHVGVAIGGALVASLGLLPVTAARRHRRKDSLGEPAGHPIVEGSPRPGAHRSPVPAVLGALATHAVAVVAYGTVLSSTGTIDEGGPGTAAVLSALVVQSSLALARPLVGRLCDTWSAIGTLLVSSLALLLAVGSLGLVDTPAGFLAAAAGVGISSGAVQTAALTTMMLRARTGAQIERASTAYNMVFDIGLGIGAVLATGLVLL